ncbi:MAG: UbiA prenyltransferase family protein [Candidatus Heimdallarchaeota archaeon]|nr:UbiA prenyltransferase family protein [Candidatus Heimdallarchaeota archaeon]
MEKSSTQLHSKNTVKDRIQAIIVLLRPHQYYKNLLVIFGLFFSENLFRLDLWIPIILAFVALSLVSSLNYIINDFRDREKDKFHPEKSHRPFPSGKISTSVAAVLMLLLIMIVVFIIIIIPTTSEAMDLQEASITIPSKTAFILVLMGLFVTSQLYSLLLKQVVFADIVTISVNYVWRAIAGAVLISVSVSPWLIILCFVTAMMLSIAKRKGDLSILGTEAKNHKKVFEFYTIELLDQSLATITAIEILAIFIYLIERHSKETVFIVVALPVITFGVFRFLYLVSMDSVAGRKAEKLFFDKQILIAGALMVFLFFIAIYFPNLLDNIIGIPDPT